MWALAPRLNKMMCACWCCPPERAEQAAQTDRRIVILDDREIASLCNAMAKIGAEWAPDDGPPPAEAC